MGATQVLRDFLPTKMWRKAHTKPRIFISYRRDDCSWFVTALHNKLSNKFGREKVFQDYNHIEAGEDFAKCIHDSVRGCNVFLVIIGKQWLTASRDGVRRLDDPQDFVRLEIAAALKRRRWAQIRGEIRVVPVLVDGADMPSADELPDDLADLANYQAQRIDTSEFDVLSDALIEQIKPSVYPWRYRIKRMIKPAVGSLVLAMLGYSLWNFNALVWWNTWQAERALDQKNYVSAISNYQTVMRWRVENHEIRLKLADSAYEQGNAYEANRASATVNQYYEIAVDNYKFLLDAYAGKKKFEIVEKLASAYTGSEKSSEAIATFNDYIVELDAEQQPLSFEMQRYRALVYMKLGKLYLYVNWQEDAIEILGIARELFRPLDLPMQEANTLFSLANAQKKRENFGLAMDYYHDSWKKYCEEHDFGGVTKVLFNGSRLADTVEDQGDPYLWIKNRADAFVSRECTA